MISGQKGHKNALLIEFLITDYFPDRSLSENDHYILFEKQEPGNILSSTLSPPSCPVQVHQDPVPGHHVPAAEGVPAAVVLGHDVRVRGRQHAAAAGDLPGVGASAGPAAVHHDPGEPGRDAAV